jgi:hypothetical protein
MYMNRLLSEELFRTKGEFLWMFLEQKRGLLIGFFDLLSNLVNASKTIRSFNPATRWHKFRKPSGTWFNHQA